MKIKLPYQLSMAFLLVIVSFHLQAQSIIETFESYPITGVSSFTNSGQQFNLIGTSFSVNQFFTGNGYGPSDKYIDNAGNTNTLPNGTGTNKTYSIKTNDGKLFSVKQLFLFVSTDGGTTVGGGSGTVTIKLKKGSNIIQTINLSNSFFLTNFNAPNQGFTQVDFKTAGASDFSITPMDELEINYGTGFNYFAIDNFTFNLVSNWTGGTGAWSTGSNWDRASIPTSTTEVYIASGSPSVSGTINCASITVNGTGTLTIPSAANLQVGSSITSSSAITATAGTITLNGTAAQTIPASTFTGNTIANLTINNSAGVTIGGTLNITGILTPTTGTLTTGGFVTLKSTSIANTAMVGVKGASASISGNVTVERFIPARRGFRLLAPGVTTATTIKANWQEGQNNTTTASNSNTNAGYGTHITGSTNGSNGFDATGSGNPSLFTFGNNSANTWTQAANTGTATLSATRAYRILVRGSRSINLSSNTSTADNTVLRATGALNENASIVFNNASSPTALNTTTTVNQNFSLVPNPYWCTINWNTLTKSGIGGSYYIWDPTQSVRGTYTSWNGTVSSGGGTINQYIQPGQAFFITSTTGTPSLTIQQSDKVASASNLTTTFRTQNNFAKLIVSLTYNDASGNKINADAATAIFGNYSKAIDNNEEAFKLTNLDEMISINRNGTLLSIEARPIPTTSNDTLSLMLDQYTQTQYNLEIAASNFNNTVQSGFVVDKYLNKIFPLNMDDNTIIPFTLTNDADSKSSDRFMIVLGKSIAATSIANGFSISLSPNPVSDILKVNFTNAEPSNTTITIVSSEGKIIKTVDAGNVLSGQLSINVKGLAKGNYFVTLYNGKESKTEKLQVQ